MTHGDFQIFIRGQATKLVWPVVASRTARWGFVLSLAIASLLAGPLRAADSPGRSAVNPYLAADAPLVQALGVRYFSRAGHCRVVIDLTADVRYRVGHLSNPERVYLDLHQIRTSPQFTSRRIALNNGLVDQIRMGTDRSVTRIVLDLHPGVRYRVSEFDEPARMVVELSRLPEGAASTEAMQTSTDVRQATGQTSTSASPNSSSPSESGQPQGTSSPSPDPARVEPRAVRPSPGPNIYGDAEKASLDYAGTSHPQNILWLDLTLGSSYTDNVLDNRQHRISDVAFLLAPSFRIRREGRLLGLALDYQPYLRIFRKFSAQDVVDQTIKFDSSYQTSSHLSFRTRASVSSYTTGIFQPNQNEGFLTGLGSPSSLNGTLFAPTVSQLAVASRFDVDYQASLCNSFNLFLGLAERDFNQRVPIVGSLLNMKERNPGLLYRHRLSPHTTVGIGYLFQDFRFGSELRTLVHSALFYYAQEISPSLTLSTFAGPQRELSNRSSSARTHQVPVIPTSWQWAMGGVLTKRSDKNVFSLTAQHQISDGEGLLGAVISSSVEGSVRHRLPGRLDGIWSVGFANNSSLSRFIQGRYQTLTAGTGLERSLTEKLNIRVRYDFFHQHGTGQSPLLGNFDRDLWSVELFYSFYQKALGR